MELNETNDVALVATVEDTLELRLEAAEAEIRALKATAETGRKTRSTQTLTKPGVSAVETITASALDLALTSLSVEQRIAVKSELLRSGLLR
ncbi:hypothetical protein [Terriglobus saanensis]|uniref:Putative ATP synthase subunit n=1 Tax=Terriglobus saanensis (strain ATCC BAA-1853 / DSM 23119 / SP1PR4) TaxID=401053 RepID=E8UYY7_TERSS|nr:hypothetical protein [Terriglobus saanensis]ADV80932.1 putative ATP synthase subunit [Terriglobus saanensis SP1PR4]